MLTRAEIEIRMLALAVMCSTLAERSKVTGSGTEYCDSDITNTLHLISEEAYEVRKQWEGE